MANARARGPSSQSALAPDVVGGSFDLGDVIDRQSGTNSLEATEYALYDGAPPAARSGPSHSLEATEFELDCDFETRAPLPPDNSPLCPPASSARSGTTTKPGPGPRSPRPPPPRPTVTDTMHAVVTTGVGGFEKLEFKTVPTPRLGPGEVLAWVLF